jgi:hypothetical protein
MSKTSFAMAVVAVSALFACAALALSRAPALIDAPAASQPSLTKYHNARLRQDRPSERQ